MYKRLTLQQLLGIQSKLFQHLQELYKAERCATVKEYLRTVLKEGKDIYHLREGNGFFRISQKEDGTYIFTDETEKIELVLDEQGISELHNLLKGDKKVQKIMKGNQSIRKTLEDEFEQQQRRSFEGKPYIVYDIETTRTTNDLKNQRFVMGYVLESSSGKYKYIEEASAQKFTDYLLSFDGRIVGFNNIGFDNPVMLYNTTFTQDALDHLNKKSVDIFYFMWQRIGRKISLNKLSEALIGIKKTLESGAEGSKLLKERQETGDLTILETVKKYCKNDVKMTHLVFLYLLKYQKLFDEGTEIPFDNTDLITYGQVREEEPDNTPGKAQRIL